MFTAEQVSSDCLNQCAILTALLDNHTYVLIQFPTVVRGIGMGYSYVVSRYAITLILIYFLEDQIVKTYLYRFGTILAPFILLLGDLSPMVFGAGAFMAGWLTLMLPETLGRQGIYNFMN